MRAPAWRSGGSRMRGGGRMGKNDLVIDTIKENYQQMFSAEKKVADYILQHPEQTVSANVSELAELSGVSDATVIRMCKHLGYQGFYQMKLNLARDLGQHQLVGYMGDQNNPDTVKAILQGIARNLLDTAGKLGHSRGAGLREADPAERDGACGGCRQYESGGH